MRTITYTPTLSDLIDSLQRQIEDGPAELEKEQWLSPQQIEPKCAHQPECGAMHARLLQILGGDLDAGNHFCRMTRVRQGSG